ncbi:MAG: hypothetical protein QOJ94_2364 [Sphingomonadales bacterium]|nr:hypothetical protein [Sphingomonadales bacterium]
MHPWVCVREQQRRSTEPSDSEWTVRVWLGLNPPRMSQFCERIFDINPRGVGKYAFPLFVAHEYLTSSVAIKFGSEEREQPS